MHVLVCGIPGTGKSTFARWLAREHGYTRCPRGDEPSEDFAAEVNAALAAHERVVVDWGFPAYDPDFAACIQFVRDLVASGVSHWWFDGDRDAALQSFLNRDTAHKSDWDRQLAGIAQHWPEISALFGGRQLDVIFTGPTYLPRENILERIIAHPPVL